MKVTKIADVTGYKIGKDGGDWVAFKSCDTTLITPKQLKDKKTGRPLVLYNPSTGSRKVSRWVKDYVFSHDGKRIALSVKKPEKDSVTTEGIGVYHLPDTSYTIIDRDRKFYGAPVFSEDGSRLAYIASNDTNETGTKRTTVYLSELQRDLQTPS